MRVLLPVFELSSPMEGTAEAPASWVQCAKLGKFFSKRFQKFEISEQTFTELTSNFDGEVNVDYDHFSTLPLEKRPTPDAGKAAGWVKKLERRGAQLWAFVEWTKTAAQQIVNKEFRYISPTFQPNAIKTEASEPEPIGAKLFALALTNQPFISGMAPVMLSQLGMIELAELSLEDKTVRIAQAFYAKFGQDFETPYIDKVYEDHVICRKGGKIWKIEFTANPDFSEFEWKDAVEVVYEPVELSKPGDNMADDPKKPAEPKPGEETKPPAPPEPKPGESGGPTPTPSVDPVMLSRMQNIENENRMLKRRLDESEAGKKVDGLIRLGKITKAQKEWAVTYCLSDPTGFETFAGLVQPVVELNREHGSGESDEGAGAAVDGNSSEAVVERFDKMVLDHIGANKGVSTSDAIRAVQEANPELALSYIEAMQDITSLSD